MKRAVIVHCWGGDSGYCWYQSAKRDLEAVGFVVSVPDMPNSKYPVLSEWLRTMDELIGEPDEDLYLIGHSLGCVAVMKYLEDLSVGQRIGGVVLVAGMNEDPGIVRLHNFFEKPLDLAVIKNRTRDGFVGIYSDNDPYINLKYANIFEQELGAKVVIKHQAGHFLGSVETNDVCRELPDVFLSIKELVSKFSF